MGKKYLETKKDTLESSILGVWKTAIEEGEAIKDAAQMIKKEVKLDESQIEEHLLEMSEEQFDNFIEDLDDDLLEGVEMILDETIDLNEKKPGLLGKIGGAIASRIPGTTPALPWTIRAPALVQMPP